MGNTTSLLLSNLPDDVLLHIVKCFDNPRTILPFILACKRHLALFRAYDLRRIMFIRLVREYATVPKFAPAALTVLNIREIFNLASNITEWRQCTLFAVICYSLYDVAVYLADYKSKGLVTFVKTVEDTFSLAKTRETEDMHFELIILQAIFASKMKMRDDEALPCGYFESVANAQRRQFAKNMSIFIQEYGNLQDKIDVVVQKHHTVVAALKAELGEQIPLSVKREIRIAVPVMKKKDRFYRMNPKERLAHYIVLLRSDAYMLVSLSQKLNVTIADIWRIL
jgi:hypothetical protein